MAGQMPVVVVSLRRRSHAQGTGLTPPSFLPLQPVFPLAPRHLPPALACAHAAPELGAWSLELGAKQFHFAWLTRTTQQANHAPSPSEWGMRVGAAYTQTGVLAKGRAKGTAGEIEELGRGLGLAGASPPPKAGTRREAGHVIEWR